MEQRICQTLADVLGLDVGDVALSTSRTNTAAWDSLKHIELVMALETEFGVSLSVAEIEAINSVGDIVRTLQAKA
jgi:acyl carrier protein